MSKNESSSVSEAQARKPHWISIDRNEADSHVAMNVPGGVIVQSIFFDAENRVTAASTVFVPGARVTSDGALESNRLTPKGLAT